MSWYGFFVPLKTPTEIITKLNNDTVAALADPSVQGRLVPLGYESRPDSPAQVGAFLKAEVELWSRVIKEAGIVPQDLRGIGLTAHAQAGPAGGKLTIYADSHSHVLSLEHFRTFAGML